MELEHDNIAAEKDALEELKTIRDKLSDKNSRKVARSAGIDPSWLNRFKNDKIKNIDFISVTKLKAYLNK